MALAHRQHLVQRWGEQTPALLLGNIRANMPPGGNENLTEVDYLNLVAHILSQNGVDSVITALTPETILKLPITFRRW